MPRPTYGGATMKLALAMCDPGPSWFGFIFAEPSTVPSWSTATTVRLGGRTSHMSLARSSVTSRGQV